MQTEQIFRKAIDDLLAEVQARCILNYSSAPLETSLKCTVDLLPIVSYFFTDRMQGVKCYCPK